MADIESSSPLIPSDDDQVEEEIPELDPIIMNQMVLATDPFKDDPAPDFRTLAGDSEELKTIATNLEKILTADGYVKYSKENRKDLSLVIRTFIYQSAIMAKQSIAPIANVSAAPQKSPTTKSAQSQVSVEDFQKLTKELLKAQQEAKERVILWPLLR